MTKTGLRNLPEFTGDTRETVWGEILFWEMGRSHFRDLGKVFPLNLNCFECDGRGGIGETPY